jgi:hypothetical protein
MKNLNFDFNDSPEILEDFEEAVESFTEMLNSGYVYEDLAHCGVGLHREAVKMLNLIKGKCSLLGE